MVLSIVYRSNEGDQSDEVISTATHSLELELPLPTKSRKFPSSLPADA